MRLPGHQTKENYDKLKKEEQAHYILLEGTEIYVLKEGETESVDGLKSALQQERDQSSRRGVALEALKDVDPVKYKELVKQEEDLKRQQAEVATQLTANNTQWEEKLERQTKKLKTRSEALMEALTEALIDRSLLTAAGDKVLSPKIWLRAAKDHARLIEEKGEGDKPVFRVEVIDPDKKTARISQKSNGPMTLEELVEDLGTKDDFKPLYKAPNAAGSGAGGQQRAPGGGGGTAAVLNREDAMDPAKYRAAKKEAEKTGQGLPTIEPPPSMVSTGT
jgi:hypothetical protein